MQDEQERFWQNFESELADIWKVRLCHRAIQAKIGQELAKHYPLPEELPHNMFTLLMQME